MDVESEEGGKVSNGQTGKQPRGRRHTPPHLKRVDVPLRLPAWIRDQIRDMGAPGDVIEAALIKAYKLKPPKDA